MEKGCPAELQQAGRESSAGIYTKWAGEAVLLAWLRGGGAWARGSGRFVVPGHRALLCSFLALFTNSHLISQLSTRPPGASVSSSVQCGLVTPHRVFVRIPDTTCGRPA